MFETHHLNQDKCLKVLEKYYVKDAPKYEPIFSYDEKGFYKVLQRKIFNYFNNKNQSWGPTK